LVGVCRANPTGASRGGTATRCSSLITGVTGAANRPGVGPATGDSVDDEVVNMVIPATTSTSAALATRPITAPGVPRTSAVPRSAHRRAPRAYPDCGVAASSSPSWLSPSMGMTGWSVTVAAGGSELVTGWKRSTTCRVCGWVGGFERLTKMGSPSLDSVLGAGPCRAGPGPTGDWFGFTAAITSLAGSPATGVHQLLFVPGRLRCSHVDRSVSPCRYGQWGPTLRGQAETWGQATSGGFEAGDGVPGRVLR
jgi:hypothetical protein